MANWTNRLNIASVIQDENIDPVEAGKEVVKRMKELKPRLRFGALPTDIRDELKGRFDDIVSEFEMIESGDLDHFNQTMEMLYDLGDEVIGGAFPTSRKFIWIETYDQVTGTPEAEAPGPVPTRVHPQGVAE